MYNPFRDAFRRLRCDERGNVFILFAATAVPLLLVMGGAIDMTRHARYKADLANAVDSAALALARQGQDLTEEQATAFVTEYVTSFPVGDDQFTVETFDVDKLDNGFLVKATGSMQTAFLPIGKLASMTGELNAMAVNVLAEVLTGTSRLELAFVFDNTGSMNCGNIQSGNCANNWSNPGSSSRIFALKAAAHTLVNDLMTDVDDPNLRVALIPFEGDVNVGQTYVDLAYAGTPPAWLDWINPAQAKYNGQNLGKYNFVTGSACTTGADCKFVGHKWLYSNLYSDNSNVKWAGCVEMRAEPYDLLDTIPSISTPNTLFVPRFWPDEPDSDNDDGDNYQNNYLDDNTSQNGSTAQKRIQKYYTSNIDWHSTPDTTFPYQSGPNFGCPRPIVALTSTKATVEAAIDNMIAYYSTGTFIPTGLVWGWHVLSSTEPFTQGIDPSDPDYDKTLKAVVLFTDGENFISDENNHNHSRYSGYNYTGLSVGGAYRLGDQDADDAVDTLDDKTAELCENVKANGTSSTEDDDIRLYTVTFGSMSSADEDLMRDCASVDDDGEPLYFHAPTTSALEGIFNSIGQDLTDIYLSM